MTPWAAEEELQVPGCYPYGVRARGSERSRHMRGGFVQWSIEKVSMLVGTAVAEGECRAGTRNETRGWDPLPDGVHASREGGVCGTGWAMGQL